MKMKKSSVCAPRASRRRIHPVILEMMEPRALLSATYSAADISNTWALGGIDKTGAITFDGTGNVTTGSLTNQDGTTSTILTGTDTVSSTGSIGLSLTTDTPSTITATGTINATKDIVALNEQSTSGNTTTIGALDLLVNNTGNFSQSELAGTWNIAAQDYRGTITINAAGHVTGGQIYLEDNTHNASITGGTAVLNADGTGTLSFTTKFKNGDSAFSALSLNLTLDASQDVAVANSSTIGQVSGNSTAPAELTVLLKSAGAYASADVIGSSWNINAANGSGSIHFLAHSLISGTFNNADGTTSIIAGNYSVGGNGTLVANLTLTNNSTHAVSKESLFGAINRSKNLIALDRAIGNPANEASSLTILTSATNHPPTERLVATLTQSAFQTSALTITYADIVAVNSAHDIDGDPISFLITSAPSAAGNLTITDNGVTTAVIPGTTVMNSSDVLTFTPAATDKGEVNIFSVLASDGSASAANPTKIFIDTAALPAVTATATKANALETKAGSLSGDGVITISRTGSTAQALTVTFSVTGTAIAGTNYNLTDAAGNIVTTSITIPAGKSSVSLLVAPIQDDAVDPTLTVDVTVEPDPNVISPVYTPSVHAIGHAFILDSNEIVTITPRVVAITEGASNVASFIVTRLPAQGGNVNDSLTVTLAYTGTFDVADHLVDAPATITFTPGQVKKIITLSTTSDGIADPGKTITASIYGNFTITGSGTAFVTVLDDSPVVRITAPQSTAFEAHPGVGGKFLITRTGPTTAPLTVDFATSSTAVDTTNYTLTDPSGTTLTDSVLIPIGASSVVITLTPVDDFANDPTLNATLMLQQDVALSYSIVPLNTATVHIKNNDRPPTIANTLVHQSTTVDVPLTFTFDQLVTLTGASLATGETNGTLQLVLGNKFAGHIQIVHSASDPETASGGTIFSAGDSLIWTPPAHLKTTNLPAFTLKALDGTDESQAGLFAVTITPAVAPE